MIFGNLQAFPSFPYPTPSFLFCSRPNFARAKYRSLIFLCSPTLGKCLLRRLHISLLFCQRKISKKIAINNLELRKTEGFSSKQQPAIGLFTGREGYPRERVNPSWRAKDSPGFQAKFHRKGNPTTWDDLMRGYTQGHGNN